MSGRFEGDGLVEKFGEKRKADRSPQCFMRSLAAKLLVSPRKTPNSIHWPEHVGWKGDASEKRYWMVRSGKWCCSRAFLISTTKESKSVLWGISGVLCMRAKVVGARPEAVACREE